MGHQYVAINLKNMLPYEIMLYCMLQLIRPPESIQIVIKSAMG